MKKLTLLLAALPILFVSSCKKDPETTGETKHAHLGFTVTHKVGSSDLEMDKLQYTNKAGHKFSVTKLQYFISGIELKNTNGNVVKYGTYHYVDAADSTTFKINPDIEVPAGSYSSISLIIGIDSTVNKTGLFNTSPEIGMEWPTNTMQKGGYHYMKLEGQQDSLALGTTTKGYKIHTGPTMGKSYEVHVELANSAFEISSTDKVAALTFDVNEWLENPTTYDWNKYMEMVMMDMSAQMALEMNGKSVISVTSVK